MSRGANVFKGNIDKDGAEEYVQELNTEITSGVSQLGKGYKYSLGAPQGADTDAYVGLYLYDPNHSSK